MSLFQSSEAAALLLQRRRARTDLAEWARVCGFEPAKHHLLLIEYLKAVVRGEIKRLAVFMPPGSAKSTYSSKLFPPWFLAQKPQSNILACSHSADLAAEFGRDSRNLINTNEQVLGYGLCQDSQAADRWSTDKGGLFFCAGVGGKIAGRRADLALIDDPIGSKEDADSKIIRDKAWHWYITDFKTRLKPNAARILIQTRWHEDDLAGRILAKEGNEWVVINLPMEAEENDPLGRAIGEMLWSDYFTPEMITEAKQYSQTWSALYQQHPSPEDGDYFRKSWIEDNAYDLCDLPRRSELTDYVASDHACSEAERADSSCIIPAGVDENGEIWIYPDVFWQRCDTLVGVETMVAMMRKRSFRTWWMENEKITKSIGPFLKIKMRDEKVFCYIEPVHPAKNKETRAQSIRGMMQAGMVHFPRQATWYNAAMDQMMKFPNGTHDDFVDPLAYLGLKLDAMMRGTKTKMQRSETLIAPTMTLRWLKNDDVFQRRQREAALADN